jgi:serine protease Do
MDATLIGQDPTTDIAVLKVNTREGLFPVTRASGIELHQGERVFAFGSPFGFKFSMSEGIVSATGRDPENLLGRAGGYTNFIQTDAAVNPGNSGGPLVNVEGKLVGMNVAIATAMNSGGTSEGQNSGISFAIPLETIERVVEQIIETGGVSKGFLGISLPTTDDDNERALTRFDVKGRGVIVLAAEPSGPAGKAGIRAGDVITKINGRPITNIAVLRSMVSNMTPGQRANVEVIREGELIAMEVVVGERTLPTLVELQEARKALTRWGIDELVQTNSGNLLIASMIRGSEAMRVGLRPGMIVSRVEGEPVRTIEEFDLATARPLAQGRRITVTVSDDQGQERDVEINPRP